MAEIWVANASPVIVLSRIGKLELIERIPTRLVLPSAVAEEILAGPDDPAHRALTSGWGSRSPVTVPEGIAEWGLGHGESAVISLAKELQATAVVDDRSARRCATAIGVPVIGTLGVVIRARKMGLIDAARPVIQSILDAGLYYEAEAVKKLLESLGESWP